MNTEKSDFLEQKQAAVEKQAVILEQARIDFDNVKKKLSEETKKLNKVIHLTIEEWKLNNKQLSFEFPVEK